MLVDGDKDSFLDESLAITLAFFLFESLILLSILDCSLTQLCVEGWSDPRVSYIDDQ